MAKKQQGGINDSAIPQYGIHTIQKRNRYWEVRDSTGSLVCLTVYKCGAQEVVRRMSLLGTAGRVGSTAVRL